MSNLIKKLCCILLTLTLIFSIQGNIISNASSGNSYPLGDANMDGTISISDVTCIQLHLTKATLMNEYAQYLASVNGNSTLGIRDATVIQLYLAKRNYAFPKNIDGYKIGEIVNYYEPTTTPTTVPTTAPTTLPTTAPTTATTGPTAPSSTQWVSDGTIKCVPYQISNTSVKVSFKGEYGATRYLVRAYTSSSLSSSSMVFSEYAADTGVTVSGLKTKTNYYFTVRAYKGSTALTPVSSTARVYMMPNVATKNATLRYKIENLPCSKRVFQAFYIDKETNTIYVTQTSPCYDNSGNLSREDTVIAKCPINGNVATCTSFMLIKNGGHGVVFNGYYTTSNELKLYVGCDYNSTYGAPTSLSRIGYDEKYANKYNASTGKWVSYDGTVINYEHKTEGKTGMELTGAGFCNSGVGISIHTLTRVDKLLGSNEKFAKFDYIRCGGAGKCYFLIKYKNTSTDTTYLRVLQVKTNLDVLLHNATSAVASSEITTSKLYDTLNHEAFFLGGWQSSGIKDVSTQTAPQLFITGNCDVFAVQFKDIKNKKLYVTNCFIDGYKYAEQEEEGAQFIDGQLYFGHQFKDRYTGKRSITIQSITVD